MPRAIRFASPSRGASGPAFMNLTRIDERAEPQRVPDVVLGRGEHQLAQAEQLESTCA